MAKENKHLLENQLRFYEEHIKNQNHESFAAYDQAGRIILQKDGGEDSVTITKNEGAMLKGTVFTHNHPAGQSFSIDDIMCACLYEMKEIRCIAKNGGARYIMCLGNGTNFTESLWEYKICDTYSTMMDEVCEEFAHNIIIGVMTRGEANSSYIDAVWERVAEQIPELHYEKVM